MNRFFRVVLLLTIFAVLGVPIPSLSGPVPDTSQTKCHNNTQVIPCPQPGEPSYGQNAKTSSSGDWLRWAIRILCMGETTPARRLNLIRLACSRGTAGRSSHFHFHEK